MQNDPAKPNTTEVEASQSRLTIIRIEPGHEEPEGEDYVQVSQRVDGGYSFSGVVSIHADGVGHGSRTSTSNTISPEGAFATADAAEMAAVEWAAEQGAEMLYVLGSEGAPHLVGEMRASRRAGG